MSHFSKTSQNTVQLKLAEQLVQHVRESEKLSAAQVKSKAIQLLDQCRSGMVKSSAMKSSDDRWGVGVYCFETSEAHSGAAWHQEMEDFGRF